MNNTTGAAVYVDSSSADDGYDQNKGVAYMWVHGFDINGDYVVDKATCNGTTGTATTNITNYRTVFWADPASFGATVKAVGNMFVQDDAAGTTKYLGISANATKGSHCWFLLPPNVIAAFEISCHAAIATTATDSFALQVDGTRDGVTRNLFTVNSSSPGVALQAALLDFSFIHEPVEWEAIKFSVLKTGTTNQTVTYNLKWGFRFK